MKSTIQDGNTAKVGMASFFIQSRVQIEHYFVMYFKYIAMFELL